MRATSEDALTTPNQHNGYAASDPDTCNSRNEKDAQVDTAYPALEEASPPWEHEVGGDRAYPRIPSLRCLQTAAVLFHTSSILLLVLASWAACVTPFASPFAWPVVMLYLVHLSTSTATTDGRLAYRSERLRRSTLWKWFAVYFPMRLYKTFDLPSDRKYIFGYHPHGILGHGAWCAFATDALGFSEQFLGILNTCMTLHSNFRLPLMRYWMLVMGLQSVHKESIYNILSTGGPQGDGQGRAVTIAIGGAREALLAKPGTFRLILKSRKGFIKMALRTGADLVPIIGFGENDLYEQIDSASNPALPKFQQWTLRVLGYTVPILSSGGLFPRRRSVNIIVGKPIHLPRRCQDEPSEADIILYHDMYVEELEKLFAAYKHRFSGPNPPAVEFLYE